MALVTCMECQQEVSQLAIACPGCGAPVQNINTARAIGDNVNTIQEPSKRLKLHIIGSVVVIFLSLMLFAQEASVIKKLGLICGFGGFCWFIVTKLRIWWHHK